MSCSILLKTIVLTHGEYGDFKFEIYLEDHYYYADIWHRHDDGRWLVCKSRYGFSRASSVEDAQKSCVRFVDIYAK